MARRAPTPTPPAVTPVDVRIMDATSGAIYVLAALTLLAAGVLWLTRAPWFSIRVIELESGLSRSNVHTIRANALPQLQGNFFSIDLQRARAGFESAPWVRQASVRRIWPDRLAVQLQEHQAVALWEADGADTRLVNSFGEVFEANLGDVEEDDLPVFDGPPGQSRVLWAMYNRLKPQLATREMSVARLSLSGRGSWMVQTDDGARIELGRGSDAEVLARVERFARTLAQVSERFAQPLLFADLRHTDGYAVRLQGVTTAPAPADKKLH